MNEELSYYLMMVYSILQYHYYHQHHQYQEDSLFQLSLDELLKLPVTDSVVSQLNHLFQDSKQVESIEILSNHTLYSLCIRLLDCYKQSNHYYIPYLILQLFTLLPSMISHSLE